MPEPLPAKLTKYYEAAIQEGPCGAAEAIALITTDRVDRDNEVVVPAGCRLENYRANPVVMYGHAKGFPAEGEAGLPVGKNLWIKPSRDGHGLIAKHEFDLEDQFSFRICGKVKRGFLRTYSITFQPIAGGPPTKEEIATRPDWAGAKTIYREWELVEYSVVALPANVDAVTLAKRGNRMPDQEGATAAGTAVETEAETVVEAGAGATPPEPAAKAMGESTGAGGGLTVPDETAASKATGEDEPEPGDDGEDDEEEEPIARGDHVKCRAPHVKCYGVVKSIHKGEMVPDVEDDVYGSKSEPAARIQLHKKMRDGYVATEVHRGVLCKHCEKCDRLMPPKKKKDAPAPTGWTAAERAAYKAALMASPEHKGQIAEVVRHEIAVKIGKA